MTDTPSPHLEPIAWIALVARWTELARASRVIPATNERLRASIAPIITMEANTAALQEITRISEADRPHARALAEISIRTAAQELDRLWRGEEWPAEFFDACEAAERALRNALYAGLEALVVEGDEPIEVPEFDFHAPMDADPVGADTEPAGGVTSALLTCGTLAAMPPGSLAMPSEPIAWWTGRLAPTIRTDVGTPSTAGVIATLARRPLAEPLQVYRGLDDRGRFTHDTLAPITEELLPGLPMLVPLLIDGVRVGRFLHERNRWRDMQRAAMGNRTALEVRRSRAT